VSFPAPITENIERIEAHRKSEKVGATDWDDEGSLKYRAKSSLFKFVGKQAHNPKVTGSNPVPATKKIKGLRLIAVSPFC